MIGRRTQRPPEEVVLRPRRTLIAAWVGAVAVHGPQPQRRPFGRIPLVRRSARFLGQATAKVHCVGDADSDHTLVPFQTEEAITAMVGDRREEFVGDLAESFTVSADKRVYTFHLRPEARWSNGDPVTTRGSSSRVANASRNSDA